MPLETVADIMLPLGEYAIVDENATMLDALLALDAAQNEVPEGKEPHRAVLVRNESGAIVGKMGHLAFLAGLEPRYFDIGDPSSFSRAGLSETFLSSMMESMSLWKADFNTYVCRAKQTKVRVVMQPIAENVQRETPIGEAIHKLVSYQCLSLLVLDRETPVGILRLSDLFSVVTKNIKRKAEPGG